MTEKVGELALRKLKIVFLLLCSISLFYVGEVHAATNWNGTWTRDGKFDKGVLEISKETGQSFYFTLNVSSGANIGYVEGNAKISGKMATYSKTEYGSTCKLTFVQSNNKINVNQTEGCIGGMGTYFSGDYQKGTGTKKEPTLADVKIITKAQEAQLKKVVGSEYQTFIESMQLIGTHKDLDGFGVQYKTGYVRGLYPYMNSLIMFDKKGYVYAATIDQKTYKKAKFFTSNPVYKTKLPKTVQAWMKDVGLSKVDYKYVKVSVTSNVPKVFTSKYPKETVRVLKKVDLDKDKKDEIVILSKQGNLFLVKGNTVKKIATTINSDSGYQPANLQIFNPATGEYQIITTYHWGPSNTKAEVYRMQKGKLVNILDVRGDLSVRITKNKIYQVWKKYYTGGYNSATAVYTWNNKKQKFDVTGQTP